MLNKLIKFLKIKFFMLTLERFPKLFRPSSSPWISGDTFRNISNHIFDETTTFNPRKVKNNDVVFVNTDVIEVFTQTIQPKITNRYTLITHNSDLNINTTSKVIDDNIIHWFAQNLNIPENKKVSFLPIGLENLRRLKNGRKKWFKNEFNKKDFYILSSFNIYTNFAERNFINKIYENNHLVAIRNFESTKDYFSNLKRYKFILCPVGNGVDTHRIWESLILKTVPIMRINTFTNTLKKNNIPGIYLNEWDDLNEYNEISLDKIYNSYTEEEFFNYVKLDYWINKINNLSL